LVLSASKSGFIAAIFCLTNVVKSAKYSRKQCSNNQRSHREMVDGVATVVATAVLTMVAHVVRVRKETDHRETGHEVAIEVHAHRVIDRNVHLATVPLVQQVIVVRVRKETDHRQIAVRVRKETDPRAQLGNVHHVLRATVSLVLNRHP
jgi:hypothetical protein